MLPSPAPVHVDPHTVGFYGADFAAHVRTVGGFLAEGLLGAESVIVLASADNAPAYLQELERHGVEPRAAQRAGALRLLDADALATAIVTDGEPSWERFLATIGETVRACRAQAPSAPLRAYCELVGVLWKAGDVSAAIRIEQFVNRLLRSEPMRLLCGYPIDVFSSDFETRNVDPMLCAHSRLVESEVSGALETALEQAIEEALGAKALGADPAREARFRPTWAVVPRVESNLLWLRTHASERVDAILRRARELYEIEVGAA